MSARRCLIISGFPPEIGRRKLITEYVKSGKGTEQDYNKLLLLVSRANQAIKKASK